MQTKTCPFCMKTELKGYFFTPYSENAETAKEPYDTALNRACRNCAHCTEMERAIARREYDGLTRFCLTFVNGRGELKSLNIRFGNDTIIFTSPNYQETSPPAPYIIGQDETRTLKARLYTLHAEFWADFYGSESGDCLAWWELLMTFQNGKELHKKGTDTLPPQWNKLLKIVGVYYKWMLQDFSAKKMYMLKYNHRTRKREKPTDSLPPFTDYWATVKGLPPTERLPVPDDVREGAKVCIYARSNQLGDFSTTKQQIEACREFCRARRLEVVAEYADEGVSGLNRCGEELKRLKSESKEKGFTHIVLASVSRFSRDIRQAIAIRNELAALGLTAIMLPPKKWGYWHYY